MTTIRTFDESTMDRLAAMLREWERLPPDAPNRGGRGVSPSAREIRFARTTTSYDYPTYPTSGPAYVVELGQYDPSPDPPYPGATITNTFTPYDPEWKVIAVDPTAGTLIANSTVLRIDKHDGRWWIIPAAAAVAATHPVLLRDANVITTSGSTYPRGGSSYSASERYTVGYQETIGSRTDNHITPMVVSSADEPFCEILTTGLYLLRLHCTVSMSGDASSFATYTTSGPSTGTSHTHTVDADDGNDVIAGVRSLLYRRVGGSGSFTALGNQSNGRWTVCLPHYAAGISGCPYASCYWHCFLNLTATWQLRQWVLFEATSTATQNLLFNEASISLQYLGEQSTAVAIT